ncbi:Carboxypeptidase G2 [Candidatus Hepatincola sp. Av]
MFKEDDFIQDLKKLTSIDCGTQNVAGVNKIADTLEVIFKDYLNFHVKRVTVSKEAGDVIIATNKKDAETFDVLLLAHMDTVYPNIAAENPLKIDNGKAYGLGSLDMKSGLLQGIYALKGLDKKDLDSLSVCFLCNPDEEIGSVYSEDTIVKYAKKSKCALILESSETSTSLVNSRYGIARMQASFKGKAAHGSTPELGISAIYELANFTSKVSKFHNKKEDIIVNVGTVEGGATINVVPEKATLGFEVRFTNVDTYKKVLKQIEDLAATPSLQGANITIEVLSFKPPLNNSPEHTWLEKIALDSCESVGLKGFSFVSSAGGSDGNITSYYAKIPTLDGLGPVGKGFHNKDEEHIELASVPTRINLLQHILLQLSK